MSKITVKSKLPNGFRRAGIHFTREGVELDTSKLKKGQLDAIENEPNLVIVPTEVEETAAERKAREKADADAAKAADKDALAREKKATGNDADKASWDAASARAAASAELTPEEFQALPAADRVARIEQLIAEDGK